jgi:hypothetical protein
LFGQIFRFDKWIGNRHGLAVQADATAATGRTEREAALAMIDRHDQAPSGASRTQPIAL